MGCCYSFFCNEENRSQPNEPNERTHLLVDPVSNCSTIPHAESDDFLNRNSQSEPKKTDEQSALNRILQETATNVIDVAALDSHNLQQHEYLERMKQYNAKLQQTAINSKSLLTSQQCVLQDISAPEKVLGVQAINPEDLQLITSALSSAEAAIKEIRIEHKEDLVVPFRIA